MANQGKFVWEQIEERATRKPPRSREIIDVGAFPKLLARSVGGRIDARPKEKQ